MRLSRFLLFLPLLGCLTPIDFSVPIAGGQIVVSGQVSTIADQSTIQLGTTADTERLPIPLSGAFITLHDDMGGSFLYAEDLTKPGNYLLENAVVVPGRTYHVEITLPNDHVYESKGEKMPEAAFLDSVYYEIVNEDFTNEEGFVSPQPFIKLYANSSLPEADEPLFLRWRTEETFLLTPTDFPDPFGSVPPPCFVTKNADPQNVELFDGSTLATTKITGNLIATRLMDWSFLEKHYFTVHQSSLTEEAYDYWRKIGILASQVGSIFDTPPAEITGNITSRTDPSEKVLGYFQAVNQSYKRLLIHPNDLPFLPLAEKCTFDPNKSFNDYPSRCLDCVSQVGSSFIRPEWF